MAKPTMYVAGCEDFHSPPFPTEAQAERRAAGMDHMNNCPHPHVVTPVEADEHGVYRYPNGRMVDL